MKLELYKRISAELGRLANARKQGNKQWEKIALSELESYEDLLPSGSGIDSGCKIDLEKSRVNKIVINSSYHLMDEFGGYCGWVDFKVTVTPQLSGFPSVRVMFIDYKHMDYQQKKLLYGLTDYLYNVFYNALNEKFED